MWGLASGRGGGSSALLLHLLRRLLEHVDRRQRRTLALQLLAESVQLGLSRHPRRLATRRPLRCDLVPLGHEAGALLGLLPHRGPECYAVVLADACLPLVGAVAAVAHAVVDHGGEDLGRLVPFVGTVEEAVWTRGGAWLVGAVGAVAVVVVERCDRHFGRAVSALEAAVDAGVGGPLGRSDATNRRLRRGLQRVDGPQHRRRGRHDRRHHVTRSRRGVNTRTFAVCSGLFDIDNMAAPSTLEQAPGTLQASADDDPCSVLAPCSGLTTRLTTCAWVSRGDDPRFVLGRGRDLFDAEAVPSCGPAAGSDGLTRGRQRPSLRAAAAASAYRPYAGSQRLPCRRRCSRR